MRVLVVANQASGRGRAVRALEHCERRLRAAGLAPERLSLDAPADEWRSACLGSRGVVAVGGDGTVRSVAARLRATSVPLAIVPAGTENLAAREFGFLRPRVPIAEALVRNRVRPCDLGVLRRDGAADHVFVVMVSAGLDADVVADVAANRRGPISHASYLGPIIRTCRRWQPASFEATGADGARLLGRGQLVVANARQYAMRMDPARAADPADGMLDAVALDARGWMGMVGWAVRLAMASGTVAGAAHGRSASWGVRFDRPVALQADGDPVPGGAAREIGLSAERGALAVVDVRPR